MPIAFRPFRDPEDFAVCADLWNRANPEWPLTASELHRKDLHRTPESRFERGVGEQLGRPVCAYVYEDQFWAHRPGRKSMSFYLDPELEEVCVDAIVETCEAHMQSDGSNELNAWTADYRTRTMAGFEKNGFRIIERQPVSRLDLREFDPSEYAGLIASIEREGCRFARFTDFIDEGWDWVAAHLDATMEIRRDIPNKQEATDPDPEIFRKWILDDRLYDKSRMFAILKDREILAYTRLEASEADPGFLATKLTGVRRAYRRQGLATAIKAYALASERARGAVRVMTDNLDHNPMLSINLKLGFKPRYTWLHFVKNL